MKIGYDLEEATRITADFKGNVQDYSLMWLNLYNNARENRRVFYNIRNTYDSNVIKVVCERNSTKTVVDYLKRIGCIVTKTEDINVVLPYADYENDDEYDYEFANYIEE